MSRRCLAAGLAVLLACGAASAKTYVVTRPEEFGTIPLDTTRLQVVLKSVLPEAPPYEEDDLAHLARLSKLQALDLSKAGAQAHGRDGVGMSKWDLRLTDRGLAHIAKVKSLETLELTDTPRITEAGLRLLAGLPRLRHLAIRHWGDYGMKNPATLETLAEFAALESLVLDGCRGEHEATWTKRIAECARIRKLSLFLCPWVREGRLAPLATLSGLEDLLLRGMSDADLTPLSRFPALRNIVLARSRELAGSGLAALSKMGTLRRLSLRGCKNLENEGLSHLAGLEDLRNLYLPGCGKITDDGLRHLRALTSLDTLYLGGAPGAGSTYDKPCAVTDAGLRHLVGLTRLRHLHLSGVSYSFLGCRTQEQGPIVINDPGLITDSGLAILRELPALERIDIEHCPGVSDEAVRAFRLLRPGCAVVRESE